MEIFLFIWSLPIVLICPIYYIISLEYSYIKKENYTYDINNALIESAIPLFGILLCVMGILNIIFLFIEILYKELNRKYIK